MAKFKLPRPRLRWTIRGRIVLAFLAMSVVSVTLGVLTTQGSNRAAQMMRSTYDDVLIANSFVRAAAGDFANLRAAVVRQWLGDKRDGVDMVTAALHASFKEDLATAVERTGSTAVEALAGKALAAEGSWLELAQRTGAHPAPGDMGRLDQDARNVEQRIEAVVSQVSALGYAFRGEAQAQVDRDAHLAAMGVGGGVLISAIMALMLVRRISSPIGQASRFAREIAAGTLDGPPPAESRDEIGDLIRAMVSMRADVGSMVGEQVAMREQSKARIAEALEGSREGVVIADASGTIRLVNSQALDFLGLRREDVPDGTGVAQMLARLAKDDARSAMLRLGDPAGDASEIRLPDGRWIRCSRHATTEGGLVALYADLSAIKEQQDRLSEANLTLDAALGNMSQGLCLFDAEDRLKLANSRFQALFGLDSTDCAPGTPYRDLAARVLDLAGDTRTDLGRLMRYERTVVRRRPGRSVTRAVTIGPRTVAITTQPLAEGGWIATYEDITARKHAEAQVAFLANHDALTRLPNRTMLAKRVDEALGRVRRGASFAVHYLDLDHFKQVNDTLGHAVGDQLLLAVADRLLSCVRDTDTVARLGGDEFAILQAEAGSPEQVAALAQRVVDAIAAPYVIDGHDINIAASVGITMAPHDGLNYGVLLKSADAALYKAKEDGRRTWRFFEMAMDESLQARHTLEMDLRRAVANQEFEIYFQPLLDTKSGKIRSFEALVRWNHPVRGMVPPDRFIPMAEDTGLIKDIGRWVLRGACTEALRWPATMRVAVNVSTIQLREPDFISVVQDALAATGLPPSRLELEITESVFMANNAKIMPILTTLRAIGVRFAMDDFGTGYSSLSTLRAFPFDKIKIDRSFVRDMLVAEAAGQIIRTILALGRSLGMRVTAEGVETRDQLEFLQREGCDEIQGFLVGRPMPAGDVIARLARDSDRDWIDKAA